MVAKAPVSAPISLVEQIGDTAGEVWNALDKSGPLSMAKLVKAVGVPRDTVMQALGWLAREGKIVITEEGRTRVVSLRQ
jgi:DNA-binding transcriptional ArsR family regulator